MYKFMISDAGKDRDGNQRSEQTDEREPERVGMARFARKSQLPAR